MEPQQHTKIHHTHGRASSKAHAKQNMQERQSLYNKVSFKPLIVATYVKISGPQTSNSPKIFYRQILKIRCETLLETPVQSYTVAF